MRNDDFREDLKPTRDQYKQIALEWTRLGGEPEPRTRVEATELLLRLKTSPTPDPAAEAAPSGLRPLHAAESARDASRAAASRVRVRERSA